MPGCGKKCGKEKKRVSRGRRSQDKYVATEYTSGLEEATDLDSTLSDATEYKTIQGKSTGSERSKWRRTPEKRRNQRPDKETRTRALDKSKQSPESIYDDDYSTERSSTPSPRGNITRKWQDRYASESEENISQVTKSSSKCATVNLSTFLGEDSTETETFEDEPEGIGCENEVCGGARVAVKTKRKRPPSDSESSGEDKTSSSEKCPDLCEYDPTKIVEEKANKCDSYCRRQRWMERQREKKQAEMDDYMLRKGFRYFDDMCKCSLKCIMSQMYGDPFMRNLAFSTVGFFLGVKLCWELDGFYIIF